ncbi:hypothetical protein EVAR_72174_1 [Eumeta japonica]|uniref:Secreted protein n=1 Tax=Eumeta variegata TaxID=151549 RepID=A0A4C1T1P0_EUMVA|nr:hypothetical protein EVAR_72174_1 [Eumeta japonica]
MCSKVIAEFLILSLVTWLRHEMNRSDRLWDFDRKLYTLSQRRPGADSDRRHQATGLIVSRAPRGTEQVARCASS